MKDMEQHIKEIEINHTEYGTILIHTEIPKDIQEMIGNVVDDLEQEPNFYYAEIKKNKDGTFDITQLRVIKPKSVNTGFMDNSKGCKNFITIIKNITILGNITAYPNIINYVIYNDTSK